MAKQLLMEKNFNPISLLSSFEKSFPETNLATLEIYWLHRQIYSKLESEMEAMLAGSGLSSGRFVLMILLDRYPEGLRPTELAQLAGVTQATISGLLISLEKAGLSERKTHHTDGRSYMIQLTAHGQEVYRNLQPRFLKIIEQFYTTLNPLEIQSMKQLLTKMGLPSEQDLN